LTGAKASSILRAPAARFVRFSKLNHRNLPTVMDISALQSIIEKAWDNRDNVSPST